MTSIVSTGKRALLRLAAAVALVVLAVTAAAAAPRGATAACDLEISESLLRSSVEQTSKSFHPNNCAFQENCVGGSGVRELLQFSVGVGNNGPDDFIVGDPSSLPGLEYDHCHGHYHRNGFLAYKLLKPDGGLAAPGKKQAWCSEDTRPFPESTAVTRGPARYSCAYQGISVGWMDVYSKNIDCQWIDITGVPPGAYTLHVEVNGDHSIEETTYENNALEIGVTVS